VKTLVPTLETIQSLSERFSDLAEELDGEYDGWGAEAVD
jgi:regulator of RNase E activity RraB